MATIVSLDAGDIGRCLLATWKNGGNHTVSDVAADLDGAFVILFGGTDTTLLAQHGSALAGKIIIDCRTPVGAPGPAGTSLAEALAQLCPGAHVVKAFNAISAEALAFVANFDAAAIGSAYTSGFYCGDDAEAKRFVAGLIGEANLDPIDCGPLANAALLESVGRLEAYLGANGMRTPFAITVVRAPVDRSPIDRWM